MLDLFFLPNFWLSLCGAVHITQEMKGYVNATNVKRAGLLLSVWLGSNTMSLAQNVRTLKVEAGTDVMYLVPEHERYRYDHFQRGKVHFNNGNTIAATLNYNFFNQEIQFINSTGDTLAIAQKYTVDYVKIGEHIFHYYPTVGYLEVQEEFPSIAFAVHRFIQAVRNKEGRVVLNDPLNESHNPLSALGNDQDKLTLATGQAYFIIDKNKRFYPAQRSSFYRIFPEGRTTIKAYIKKHRISLDQEEDIRKLLRFCSQLASN